MPSVKTSADAGSHVRHAHDMRTHRWALMIGLLMSHSSWAQSTDAQALPELPGKQLVLEHCVACHGLTRVLNAGGTSSGWRDRIQRMNRWGAKIPPHDIAPMAQFLATTLPPRVRTAAASSGMVDTSVSVVALHPIQTVLRTGARGQADGTLATSSLPSGLAQLVRAGQRARAFKPSTRMAFQQARVTRIDTRGGQLVALISANGSLPATPSNYVVEIVIEHGQRLSVPNEAIFEDGERRLVYVRTRAGDYVPRVIETGIAGERYTEVRSGLSSGDEVVTLGAFFIDAQYRMRADDP